MQGLAVVTDCYFKELLCEISQKCCSLMQAVVLTISQWNIVDDHCDTYMTYIQAVSYEQCIAKKFYVCSL